MKLRTKFHNFSSENKISHKDSLFFIGSCFSENMSTVLEKRKFSVLTNPFGIVYNPISVFKNIETAFYNKKVYEEDFFLHHNLWNSFDFHSNISNISKQNAVNETNEIIRKTNCFLQKTNYLFITFGTAWVYEFENKIVANCHKVANKKFTKRLLSITEIKEKAMALFKKMIEENPNLKIILTVSPVRHLKDGFIENNQSKSTLLLAIKDICSNLKQASYFPAYEYVLDDLRDYRFFKEDLIHPNSVAIKYILEKFDVAYFEKETLELVHNIDKINMSLNHKVSNKQSESYKIFQKKLLQQIEFIEAKGVDFSKGKDFLNHSSFTS